MISNNGVPSPGGPTTAILEPVLDETREGVTQSLCTHVQSRTGWSATQAADWVRHQTDKMTDKALWELLTRTDPFPGLAEYPAPCIVDIKKPQGKIGPSEAGQLSVDAVRAKHNHYHKDVRHLSYIDPYRVCDLFEVHDAALAHAIKKLLVAGGRGAKDANKDIKEAIDSCIRSLDMRKEDSRRSRDPEE